jgi:hypothetical protein
MEGLMVAATVVSALAAAGAVWFAWQTVQETRQLRREDRLARLPGLVGDMGALALQIRSGADRLRNDYAITRLRLEALAAASGESLPASYELIIEGDLLDANRSDAEVHADVREALEELTDRLREARGLAPFE